MAGESGGTGLAGALQCLADPAARAHLGLDERSRILVFNSEGATDPEIYRAIVGHSGRGGSMSDDPIELLAKLVAIDSVNPDLVPGGAGRGGIADFCAAWLSARGFEVHRVEEIPGGRRSSASRAAAAAGRSLMFNGHIDTVATASYDGDALDPVIRDGRLYGRGAFDMKGGVAAMMVAADRARRKGLRGDVMVACVADEEYASFGTEQVVARFRADAAIVTEPSHLEVTIAHKGFVWFDILVNGRAAHGSRPDLGIDAIAKAGNSWWRWRSTTAPCGRRPAMRCSSRARFMPR